MTRRLPVAAASLALLVAALDAYVVVAVLPAMLYDLDLTVNHIEQATPIVSGFLAGYVVVMPLVGLAADRLGRGPAFAGALLAFAAGSCLTATAAYSGVPPYGLNGLPWLVTGRVLQGVGGGALVPIALALAADAFPPGRRDVAIGAVAAVQEAGSVLGPLYGAWLVGLAVAGGAGWRLVFWLNLPLSLLCAVVFFAASRRSRGGTTLPPSSVPRTVAPVPADWVGAVLLGLGVAALVFALYPDRPGELPVSSLVLPAGVAAAVFLIGWAWRQRRVLSPIVPRHLLASREFIGSSIANLLVGGALMVALVDVPLLGRAVFGIDQLGSTLLLARFMVAVPVGALAGGWAVRRFGRRWVAAGGLALATIAYAAMATWGQGELKRSLGPLGEADAILALCGFGFGLVIAPLAAAVIDLADADHHALAASLVVLVRTFGMLVGLAVVSAYGLDVFYRLFRQGAPIVLVPGSGDFQAQKHLYEQRVTDALVAEYHGIFIAAAGLCALAAVVAWVGLAPRSARSTAGLTTLSR